MLAYTLVLCKIMRQRRISKYPLCGGEKKNCL